MNQFSVRYSARYATFTKKDFCLRKIYSKQVSSCVSHAQFQVSQFLEFEHEKDFTVFRVWGGLGLSRGGGSKGGELTQQVQAGAGTPGYATRPFRVPPLLNGASTTSTANATS